jgi:2-polyprenyl-3-methyl-5-hydroxy-6-metoxy-1,4-benzoquinol methylase
MSAVLSPKQTASTPRADICPACGAASTQAGRAWKLVNARGETEWLRCNCCRSYFMDRSYSLESEVSHTQTMTWGDTVRGSTLNTFKLRMYKSILAQMQKYVDPKDKSLLDVGCSYGGFMEAAKVVGFDVSGFDIVPQAVNFVNTSGMAAECCGSIRDFQGPTKTFDVITVLDANIYWPDQASELSDIYQRLNDGGLLVMRVADKSWLATIGTALQKLSPEKAGKLLKRAVNDHRFSMPTSSLLRLLKTTGFNVISASPKGAIHSDDTGLLVQLSFGIGIALWQTMGVFLAPGAVVIAEKRALAPNEQSQR